MARAADAESTEDIPTTLEGLIAALVPTGRDARQIEALLRRARRDWDIPRWYHHILDRGLLLTDGWLGWIDRKGGFWNCLYADHSYLLYLFELGEWQVEKAGWVRVSEDSVQATKRITAAQLRVLRNAMSGIGRSISFRLKGQKSNRDAIGTAITVEVGSLKQTKYLQAGSGFLAQHSKEIFFGLGDPSGTIHASIQWPSGLTQQFSDLPADHRIQIVEGGASFTATAFSPAPAAYLRMADAPKVEPLPLQVETWLIEPLKAPEFSLPDSAGVVHNLKELRGGPVLLNFWSSASKQSLEQLSRLQERKSALAAGGLTLLAVNVDTEKNADAAQSFTSQKQFSFPILFATENVLGIYNIIYSHLFDRRRNLPIPATFLLDADGMIVKIYQGATDPQQFSEDLRDLSTARKNRMLKALPFKGLLVQDTFQRNDFTFGVAFYQNGYLDEAAESFQQVIAARPTDADAYYNLGTLNLRQKNYEQARQYLEQTVKLRPDYPEAWNNLGMLAAQSGHGDEAEVDFARSLTLRPDYATALVNLGNLYRAQRKFDKADERLRRAFQLEPGDAEVNYSLGMLNAQQGQMETASHYLQQALEIRPVYPEALNNLGVLYVRGQEYSKAEDQFKTGIRVAPNFDQSYLNLARLYVLRNDQEQARKVLLDLLRVQPENAAAKQALEMLR